MSSSIPAATDGPYTAPIARRRSPSPVELTAARLSIVRWKRTCGCRSAKPVTTSLIAATSVASLFKNLRRAGTLAKRSRISITTPGSSGPPPCSTTSPARIRSFAPPLEQSTSATAAMLARASPRKPNDWMTARSASDVSLLVVWRTKASASSPAGIPAPSSLTRMDVLPAPRTSTLMRRAPASSAFSTSSLTTEAGRSMTSPAAIASATSAGSSWINCC